jgi:hypothetical protein
MDSSRGIHRFLDDEFEFQLDVYNREHGRAVLKCGNVFPQLVNQFN